MSKNYTRSTAIISLLVLAIAFNIIIFSDTHDGQYQSLFVDEVWTKLNLLTLSQIAHAVEGTNASPPVPANVAPTITSIERFDPESEVTVSQSLLFMVNFSKPVVGVNPDDFVLSSDSTMESKRFTQTRDVSLPIPDKGAAISDTITISDPGDILSVSIGVNITHTRIGDLKVDLLAPDGTVVKLHKRTGGNSENINRTYEPDFDGTELAGDWVLRVRDKAESYIGTLNGWTLAIEYDENIDAVVGLTGSGLQYFVNVRALRDGTYNLDVVSDSGIVDMAGNPLNGTEPSHSDHSYVVETGPPEVLSIERSDRIVRSADYPSIVFGINFSEPVRGVDAGDFVLSPDDGRALRNFTQTMTPSLPIPDNGAAVFDAVTISSSGTVRSVSVDVDISHTYISDLSVALIAPDGTIALLHNRDGGTLIDIDKTYTPNLAGISLKGNWTLRMNDAGLGDVGTLNEWTLSIEYDEADSTLTGSGSRYFVSVPVVQSGTYNLDIVSNNGISDLAGNLLSSDDPPVDQSFQVEITDYVPITVDAGLDQIVMGGQMVALNGTAAAIDGDPLTYSWTHNSTLAIQFTNSTSPSTTFTAPYVSSNTTLTLTLTADDGTAEVSDSVDILIMPTQNVHPVLDVILEQAVDEMSTLIFVAHATDEDLPSDTLTYGLEDPPAGASMDPATGAFTWTPTEDQNGIHTITVTVSDGNGGTDSQEVQVTVNVVNVAPTVDAGEDFRVLDRSEVTLSGTVSDADGDDTVTYSWSQIGGTLDVVLTGSDTLTPTFTAPDVSSDVELTFQLTADDNINTVTDTVIVTVHDSAADFVTTWKTTSASEFVRIPLGVHPGKTVMIDWGDGSNSAVTFNGMTSHKYLNPGEYKVTMTGGLARIHATYYSTPTHLTSIDQWGDIRWSTMKSAFQYAINMEYNATDVPDLSGVSSMDSMFHSASKFNGDLSGWNVSSVTDMDQVFSQASLFNRDISTWDVSSVTSMNGMFSGAASFNSPLNSWDVSSVTNMGGMFSNAGAFNSPLNSWDVSSVTDMNYMFYNADAFNSPLNSWNVSSVTDMHSMFYNADAFNSPLNSWNVSSVTDMNYMFRDTATFNQSLNSWNVSSVTDMHYMFYNADAFNSPLNTWDVSSVTDMHSMFYNAAIFNQSLNSWNVSSVTDMNSMFYNANAFNSPLNSWDVSSVTDMNSMFYNANAFNSPLNTWNVSSVTDMNSMFYNANAFNSPINTWNVSSVTDMYSMFRYADAFNSPLNSWDVSSAAYMGNMFLNATAFDQNLGGWYVVPDNVSIARSDVPGIVGVISAQSLVLDGHSPTYSIGIGGDSAFFEITNGNDLKMTSVEAKSEYKVNVTASGLGIFEDGNNWRMVEVTVSGQGDSPPTVDAGVDQNATEGSVVILNATVVDADTDSLTYAWSHDSALIIQLTNSASPSTTFAAPAVDADTAVTFTLTVDDGTTTTTDSLVVTITDIPAVNSTPVVDAGDDQIVLEGSIVTLTATATDADDNQLAHTWTYHPLLNLTLTHATTTSSWFTAPDVNANTTITFTLTADDGTAEVSDSVDILIMPTQNVHPVLDVILEQAVDEMSTLIFVARATDEDLPSDTLTYGLEDPPAGASMDPATGAFTWTPTEDQNGIHTITVTVSDGNGGTDSQDVQVTVNEVNMPPTLDVIPAQTIDELAMLTFTVNASDDDLHPGVGIEVVAGKLKIPWSIDWTPDWTALFTERGGDLRIIRDGILLPDPIFSVDVIDDAEGGLLGIAVDPEFEENQYIYMYQTYKTDGTTLNKVVRYTLANVTVSEDLVLVDGIPGASYHDGGRIQFGPDGNLYITTGDAGNPSLAQDLDSLAGKILRITREGAIPQDNPFSNSAVWSWGHRNPQGMDWDGSGNLIATEHGPSGERGEAHDEINLILPGANYGWPETVGDESMAGMQDPLLHTGSETWAPSGSEFYDGDMIPGWTGKYFVANLRGEHLRMIDLDLSNNGTHSHEGLFEGQFGRLRDVQTGPDGFLYLLTSNRDGRGSPVSNDDRILKIVPVFDSALSRPANVLTYGLEASPAGASMDPATGTFTWRPAEDQNGIHTITVTVSDGNGGTNSQEVQVTVNVVNVAPIVDAGSDQTALEGQTVMLNGTATDADGDSLTYLWSHNSSLAIQLANSTSPSTTFAVPAVDADTAVTFTLTVDDGTTTATDSFEVTVTDIQILNSPPVADAGSDQTALEGQTVMLNGTATDADGDSLTYLWSHNSSLAIQLANSTSPSTTFTAPAVDADTEITFTLTVDDGIGISSDQVTITIDHNDLPTVKAGADQTVQEGQTVMLNGTAADNDGDQLTYRWSHDSTLPIVFANDASLSTTFAAPAVDADTEITFTLTVDDGIGISSDQVTITIDHNDLPTVKAGADQTVQEGQTVMLNGTATDADGDSLTYLWSHNSIFGHPVGQFNALPVTTFTVPAVDADTEITFTLTVDDGIGISSDQVTITIDHNDLPTVKAGADQTVQEGQTVMLNGTAADNDGDQLTYRWSHDSTLPIVFANDASLSTTFAAPAVDADTEITFTLTVDDGIGISSDQVTITIDHNDLPTVKAGADQTVQEGQTVMLNGTAADNDGDQLTYRWSHDSTLPIVFANDASLSTTFAAPAVDADTEITFTLTVDDGIGISSDQVTITIDHNDLPTVKAGADQTVQEGQTVMLNGTAADNDGDQLTYRWSHDSTLPIVFANDASLSTTFAAPAVDADTEITFTLTVDDGIGISSDQVTITIDHNDLPTVKAGADQTVQEGQTVMLNGTAADNDGDQLTYRWSHDSTLPIVFANDASLSTTFAAPAVDADTEITFTLTVDDGLTDSTDTVLVTVNDVPDDSDFVTTWETMQQGESITIPVRGTYTIDWGDGTVDARVTGDQTHTYADPGNHTVRISEGITGIYLNNHADAPNLRSIDQWGDAEWRSIYSSFMGASNMVLHATDAPDLSRVTNTSYMFLNASSFDGDLSAWDLSHVASMTGMFWGASSFDGDISSWNVSAVTNMNSMFQYASTFNGDISSWNVSAVTDMNYMFSDASTFNGDISDWDVSAVTDMHRMFHSAFKFNQPLNSWNVSSVTNMSYMFLHASEFNQPLNSWNVSAVTDIPSMFFGASVFNGDISDWDVSAVTDMRRMFHSAFKFNQPLNSWNVSSVTNMSDMFLNADDFEQNLGKWYVVPEDTDYDAATETTLVVTAIATQNFFLNGHSPNYGIGTGGNSTLFSMPGSNLTFKDTTPSAGAYTVNVTASGSSVFERGNNWRTLTVTVTGQEDRPLSVDAGPDQMVLDESTVTLSGTVSDSTNPTYLWTQNPGSPAVTLAGPDTLMPTFTAPDVSSDVDLVFTLTVDDGTDTVTDTVTVTVHDAEADFVTTWSDIDIGINLPIRSSAGSFTVDWGDGKISEYAAIATDSNLHHNYDTSGTYTIRISGNFSGIYLHGNSDTAGKLQSIDQWGDIEWTTMAGAFYFASNMIYNATDVPDLSSVTDMSYMFYTAGFSSGDLSGWNVSAVTDMSYMFSGASSFNGYISSWNVSAVTNMNSMFDGASSFEQNLGNWYIMLDNASVTGILQTVGNITTQNEFLATQGPTYGIGSSSDSEHFGINGTALVLTTIPDANPALVNITSTGDFGTSNSRIFEITFSSGVVDTTNPRLESIERYSPASQNTNSQSLIYEATFSESVTGVTSSDFILSPDSTGGGTTTTTSAEQFTQTRSPNLDIPDLATVSDTITVPDSETATSVLVEVDITHDYINDLKIDIIAPDGTSITLHNNSGGNANNIDKSYAPQFGSIPISGVWTLQIHDNYNADPGVLNSWTLTINYGDTATTLSSVTDISGSGDAYYVTVSATQDGTYNLDLVSSGHGIEDAASNSLTNVSPTGADETYTVSTTVADNTNPRLESIERHTPATANTDSQTLVYKATFSEDVAGVTASDFTLSPDSAGGENTTASTGQFTQTRSPNLDIPDLATVSDTITVPDSETATSVLVEVDITHDYINDLKIDIIAPDGTSITLHNNSGGNANNIDKSYAPQFGSIPISGVWTLQIHDNYNADPGVLNSWTLTINYGDTATTLSSVTDISGSGDAYYVTVSATQDGTYNLDLVSSGHSIADSAGNSMINTAPTGADQTYTVSITVTDTANPRLASIERYSPASQNTDSQTLVYKATFSESVTGVTASDFVLSPDSTGGINSVNPVTDISGSGDTYYVTVSSSTDGTYNLDLVSSGHSIADSAGNSMINTAPTGADQTYTVSITVTDTANPRLASIERYSPASQNTDSQTLVYKATFSESVTGVTASDFVLSPGSTGGINGVNPVTDISGSGDAYYVTVSATQDGTYNLDLVSSGHGIEDAASNSLTNVSPTGADETYTVSTTVADNTNPRLESIERHTPATANTDSQTLVYKATFSEDVAGVTASDFTLSPDSAGGENTTASTGQFTQTRSPNLDIPDLATVSDTITVPDSETATSVLVEVDITHDYINDLKIDIIAPDGTSITLHNNSGGNANNIDKSYAPQFGSIPISGVWTLQLDTYHQLRRYCHNSQLSH